MESKNERETLWTVRPGRAPITGIAPDITHITTTVSVDVPVGRNADDMLPILRQTICQMIIRGDWGVCRIVWVGGAPVCRQHRTAAGEWEVTGR